MQNLKATLTCVLAMAAFAAAADDRDDRYDDRNDDRNYDRPDERRDRFSNSDLRGVWTYAGSMEATLLAPFPAETTIATPPSVPIAYNDKVTVRGTLVGLFTFDGRGSISGFEDLIKIGGLEPKAPFPLPFLPPAPESGHGAYSVSADGKVKLSTIIIDPMTSGVAGEADYDCVLSRAPRQLDCMFSRFKTYVVDPNGFEAPIAGQVTLRPQRP